MLGLLCRGLLPVLPGRSGYGSLVSGDARLEELQEIALQLRLVRQDRVAVLALSLVRSGPAVVGPVVDWVKN